MPIKGAKRLEIADVRITGIQLSGDGENWEDSKDMGHLGGVEGALTHIVDLLANGERVLIRTRYVDMFKSGKQGLPKTGGVYELQLVEVQPIRQVLEGQVVKQIEAPPAAPAPPAEKS